MLSYRSEDSSAHYSKHHIPWQGRQYITSFSVILNASACGDPGCHANIRSVWDTFTLRVEVYCLHEHNSSAIITSSFSVQPHRSKPRKSITSQPPNHSQLWPSSRTSIRKRTLSSSSYKSSLRGQSRPCGTMTKGLSILSFWFDCDSMNLRLSVSYFMFGDAAHILFFSTVWQTHWSTPQNEGTTLAAVQSIFQPGTYMCVCVQLSLTFYTICANFVTHGIVDSAMHYQEYSKMALINDLFKEWTMHYIFRAEIVNDICKRNHDVEGTLSRYETDGKLLMNYGAATKFIADVNYPSDLLRRMICRWWFGMMIFG